MQVVKRLECRTKLTAVVAGLRGTAAAASDLLVAVRRSVE